MAYATIPAANAGELRVIIREKMAKASDATERAETSARLKALFDEVMAGAENTSKFKTCVVTWVDKPVDTLDPKDILIYLVRTINDSLLGQASPTLGQQLKQQSAEDKAKQFGNTTAGVSPTFTEIYWDAAYCTNTKRVANAMFHECLHNKLDKGSDMHDLAAGIGDSGGFIQENMPSKDDLKLTGVDKTQMGAKLGTDRPQKTKI